MTGRRDERDTTRHDERLEAAVVAWLERYPSANTRGAYRRDLDRFTAWCAATGRVVLSITAEDVARYRQASERDGARPSTVARRLSALSSFYDHAHAAGMVAANPVGSRPEYDRASPTAELDPEQLRAVEQAAARRGTREAVLTALLAHQSLKLGEILALDAADVSGRPPSRLRLRHRRPPVVVALDAAASEALARHLGQRRTGPLLASEQGRLSRFRADQLLRTVGVDARLPFALSSNVLRRTHVRAAHAGGEGLDDLRARLGHRDARTTRRYLTGAAAPTTTRATTPETNRSETNTTATNPSITGDGRGLVPSPPPHRR